MEIRDFKISFPKAVTFFELPTKTGYSPIDRVTAKLETEERMAKCYVPPLSWTLTKKQRQAIRDAWKELERDPNGAVADLERVWRRTP